MEDSKECVIDGFLSTTMIGTRGEAMMLNNSSRFPSRRPSCRPFVPFLVGREGKSGERSELVHQMEASVNHRAKSSTRRRHCAPTSASRVIIAPGHPQKKILIPAIFPRLSTSTVSTLYWQIQLTSCSTLVAVMRHVQILRQTS